MEDIFKEAAPRLKVLKKNIADHEKAVLATKKVAEQAAKLAAKAARAQGRVAGGRGS